MAADRRKQCEGMDVGTVSDHSGPDPATSGLGGDLCWVGNTILVYQEPFSFHLCYRETSLSFAVLYVIFGFPAISLHCKFSSSSLSRLFALVRKNVHRHPETGRIETMEEAKNTDTKQATNRENV